MPAGNAVLAPDPGKSGVYQTKATKMLRLTTLAVLVSLVLLLIATFLTRWSKVAWSWNAGMLVPATAETYLGLWENCMYMNDPLDAFTCWNIDRSGVPLYGNNECKSFFEATRWLVVVGLIFMGIAMLVGAGVKKQLAAHSTKAQLFAMLFLLAVFVSFGSVLSAWIIWLVLMHKDCGGIKVFTSLQVSWILAVVVSGLLLLALLLALATLLFISKWKKLLKAPAPAKEAPEPVPEMEILYPTIDPEPPVIDHTPTYQQMIDHTPTYQQINLLDVEPSLQYAMEPMSSPLPVTSSYQPGVHFQQTPTYTYERADPNISYAPATPNFQYAQSF
mmetsp:Transcript_95792/g.165124  ORF Transcript_95792/g.165124 Transcript_95792/m.165124 type:complete len:332 (-) Transcript_95792:592-1587(-)